MLFVLHCMPTVRRATSVWTRPVAPVPGFTPDTREGAFQLLTGDEPISLPPAECSISSLQFTILQIKMVYLADSL